MKYKVNKISVFLEPVGVGISLMHLPVDWEIEVDGDVSHFLQEVQVRFCSVPARKDIPPIPLDGTTQFEGSKIAFVVPFGDCHMKLYTETRLPEGFHEEE